jgi:superfamily II DNA or RNA helicase
MNSNGKIIHHCLKFKKEEEEILYKNETEYKLRPYQDEAINAILKDDGISDDDEDNTENRKVLELFCGGGKTVIAGHVLRNKLYELVICIAPLRASVEQLKTRLTPFLPLYDVLLVDSDEGGITDIETLREKLEERTKPTIVFSTYKSTEDVLTEVITTFTNDMFLLVDEVHNMISKEKLCDFANNFSNSLLLSATIPEEIYEVLNVSKCFSYGISEAIKNGYCCDYEVFLPYINRETNQIDVDIPLELKKHDNPLSIKAMFLATGMLQTGSRRCIVYLASQDECDKFLEIAKIAFEEYHGIPFWGAKIDCTKTT